MAELFDRKEPLAVESVEEPVAWDSGTTEDQYDMTRMGKKQELQVGHNLENMGTVQLIEKRETSSSYQF